MATWHMSVMATAWVCFSWLALMLSISPELAGAEHLAVAASAIVGFADGYRRLARGAIGLRVRNRANKRD